MTAVQAEPHFNTGKTRAVRRHSVVVLPTGPEDPRPLETLYRGEQEPCLRYYQYLREEGDPRYEGRALAVLDGFGAPVYAS